MHVYYGGIYRDGGDISFLQYFNCRLTTYVVLNWALGECKDSTILPTTNTTIWLHASSFAQFPNRLGWHFEFFARMSENFHCLLSFNPFIPTVGYYIQLPKDDTERS